MELTLPFPGRLGGLCVSLPKDRRATLRGGWGPRPNLGTMRWPVQGKGQKKGLTLAEGWADMAAACCRSPWERCRLCFRPSFSTIRL